VIRLVTDEDFDNRILRGLLRRLPELDVVRLQDTHLSGATDPAILELASHQHRILLTQDISSMTHYATDGIRGLTNKTQYQCFIKGSIEPNS